MSCSIVLPRRPSFISIHLVHTYYPTLHTISVFVVSLQCSIHIIMIMSGIRSNVSIVICDPISPGRLCCAIHAFEYTILLKPHFCRVSASNFRSFLFSHFIFIFIYVVYDFPFVFMIFPSQMYYMWVILVWTNVIDSISSHSTYSGIVWYALRMANNNLYNVLYHAFGNGRRKIHIHPPLQW